MNPGKPTSNVKGVFAHLDAIITAIDRLERAGFSRLVAASPMPRHELAEALYHGRPSPVRWWTMAGGSLGATIGFALPSLTHADWPMILPGGKPVVPVLPYIVIVFECTVLFGALVTLLGMLFHSRLPAAGLELEVQDPRFSDDRFGLVVRDLSPREAERAAAILRQAGAEEVSGEQPTTEARDAS